MSDLTPLAPLLGPIVGAALPILGLALANWSKPIRRWAFASLYTRILADIAEELAVEREAHRSALHHIREENALLNRDLSHVAADRDAAVGQLAVMREQNVLLRAGNAQLREENAQLKTQNVLLRDALTRYAPTIDLPADQGASAT